MLPGGGRRRPVRLGGGSGGWVQEPARRGEAAGVVALDGRERDARGHHGRPGGDGPRGHRRRDPLRRGARHPLGRPGRAARLQYAGMVRDGALRRAGGEAPRPGARHGELQRLGKLRRAVEHARARDEDGLLHGDARRGRRAVRGRAAAAEGRGGLLPRHRRRRLPHAGRGVRAEGLDVQVLLEPRAQVRRPRRARGAGRGRRPPRGGRRPHVPHEGRTARLGRARRGVDGPARRLQGPEPPERHGLAHGQGA